MIRRLLALLGVVVLLIGIIAYSQYRPALNRVSGFIEADEIRVGSRLGGRVLKVEVQEGEPVTQGQTLIELEPFDLLQRENEALSALAARDADYRRILAGMRPQEVAQAKARYEQAVARLELLEAGSREQELEAARGRLRVAEAQLTLAKRNYERGAELLKSNAIAHEEFDTASERFEAAQATVVVRTEELELLVAGAREQEIRESRARVDEAREAWELAEQGSRQEDVEQAKAARDAAQAALDVVREQKKELAITCPVDGIVEALDLQKGDLVPAGAPVLSVLDYSHLWVRAYVPQNRIELHVGQSLDVSVDSFGNERFSGELSFVSREAEFTPSNVQTPEERSKQVFRIKVDLKEGLEKLRPGMTADVWLEPFGDSP
ncbi:MAG: efflux RND transporter periplasmic adaptor subunit [Planctomycetales bacterium]|nr:efflux RND transporter periplasmic adaptor subunit [Planctomycetales bacterium]